jgi:hypothetical protein
MHNRQAVDAVNTPTRHLPSEQEVNAMVTEAFEHRHVLPVPSICLNVSHQPDSHRRSTCLIPTGSSRGHAIAIGLTSARASRSPTRVSSGLSALRSVMYGSVCASRTAGTSAAVPAATPDRVQRG